MGCFLGCFGSKKDRKRRTQRYKVIPRDHQRHVSQNLLQATVSLEQGTTEKPPGPVAELRVEPVEQASLNSRKKVTFDSNVKTYEHIPVNDSTESLLEKKEKEENFPEVTQSQSQSLSLSLSQSRSISEDDSVTSSVGSYPPNHRYQNCQESDDEVEDLEYEDSDFDDEDDYSEDQEDYDDDYDEGHHNRIVCQKVWSEAIPIASEESRVEASLETVGMKRNARDRSEYIHPVLNPVENLSQWKAAKVKGTAPPLNPQKENVSFSSQTPKPPKRTNQEIAVDASLSNWLISTEITPSKKASCVGLETIASEKSLSQESTTTSLRSLEDRPILGALTVEELRQFSVTSSPRKSPSRSPDDMPIIGSVGSYWSHTSSKDSGSVSYKGIPNTTSKYREDKKVTWHSTPFETRLERALNRDSAEA